MKKTVLRVWYFWNGDEDGIMNIADCVDEDDYNSFMKMAEGNIEIFKEQEMWVDVEGREWK